MSFLSRFTGKQPPTAATLRAELASLDPAAADATLQALEQRRTELLVDGADDAIAAVDREINAAALNCERVAARRAKLEVMIAEADEREGEAARRRRYDEATAAGKAAQAALRKYPDLAKQIRDIITTVARANVAILAANEDLPRDTTPIVAPEQAVRGIPADATRVVKVERGNPFWRYSGSGKHGYLARIPDDLVEKIARIDDDSGEIDELASHEWTKARVERVVELRKTVVPYKDEYRPEPLAFAVSLPAMCPATDADLWQPGVGNSKTYGVLGRDGSDVLKAAEKVAGKRPAEPQYHPGEKVEFEIVPAGAK